MPEPPPLHPPSRSTPTVRRTICTQCLRPERACWCACVHPVPSQVEILVLQHPDEVGHAKNTARLLHLCLPNSRLEVGEVFDPCALQQWLHTPWANPLRSVAPRTLLLYPATPPDPQLPLVPAPELPMQWLEQPDQLRLVVIDGTWRKSRKMLYLNPTLQNLPRLPLHDVPQGRYHIRKAHLPGQLSSFEAAALALGQLQQWPADHPARQQLMHSFDAAMQHHHLLQMAGRSAAQNANSQDSTPPCQH